MLNLILGPSGTGKSTRLMEAIRTRAEAGERSILLVPEQFTSSTEGRIYRLLGDELSGMVSSYSFTSLAEALLDNYGGAAVRTVTDAARVVLVRRAVSELGPKITYYAKHRRSPVFLQKCAETLNELKSAGVTGPLLERLAVGPGQEKFRELAAIFSAYEAILAGTALDPGDRVALAAEKARRHPEFFAGRAVFVDEFDTFDAAKQQLLAAMLPAAPQVTVALCADGLQDLEKGIGLFSGAKQVAARLQRLAAREGCAVAAPVVLTEDLRHKEAPGLAALAEALADPSQPAEGPWSGVTLYRAADRTEEAQAVAAAIQKLARAGAEYRQMAVICRDTADYLRPVRTAFARAGIPVFISEPTTAELSAPALLARGLLSVLRSGLSTDRVLNVAKTGL
ncbi:MAG: ATP-binding protein, partial [Oscillospiraceae bacterium]|nr:ATP-binding protein [Oscillospiraceae bacterium]